MNITETRIPDVTNENIPKSKKILVDNIIKNVYPLFDEVYTEKTEIIQNLKTNIKIKTRELQSEKKTMEKLMEQYTRSKKVAKLLDRLDKLVGSGLIYDGTLKHETVILLKIIHKLPIEKIDKQLAKTIHLINKRFIKI